MAKWHLRSKRTPTGSRLKKHRKKKKFERGSEFLETKIGKRRVKRERIRGGRFKLKLLSVDKINVTDPGAKTTRRVKVLSVEKNPANPHFVRRNIVTRGAIVKTEIGLAKVTSRPGQNGIVNAVLVKEEK